MACLVVGLSCQYELAIPLHGEHRQPSHEVPCLVPCGVERKERHGESDPLPLTPLPLLPPLLSIPVLEGVWGDQPNWSLPLQAGSGGCSLQSGLQPCSCSLQIQEREHHLVLHQSADMIELLNCSFPRPAKCRVLVSEIKMPCKMK